LLQKFLNFQIFLTFHSYQMCLLNPMNLALHLYQKFLMYHLCPYFHLYQKFH
jgi:hypothetical protein